MRTRTLLTGLAAAATLAFSASAHAAYLSLGTSNTSNASTTLTGSTAGPELLVKNTNGTSASAFGLYGLLTATSPTAAAAAVRGHNSATNGLGYGVNGSHAGAGIGVNGSSPRGIGVRGQSTSGIGVSGQHTATTGTAPGVYGSSPNGTGVSGLSLVGTGVYGRASATGHAGWFQGNVTVSGTLTKGGGAFRIDHPLHPAHTYLQHSFVESPDMLDVYNGNVRTNRKGFATVTLPKYFQALNRSFRYQLTIVGRSFARAIVWKEIAHNRFTIRTDKPRVKVSWQVTGTRHDRFANANRIKVVLPKARAEQGKYLHPALYGKPRSQGIGYQSPPKLQRPPRSPARPFSRR